METLNCDSSATLEALEGFGVNDFLKETIFSTLKPRFSHDPLLKCFWSCECTALTKTILKHFGTQHAWRISPQTCPMLKLQGTSQTGIRCISSRSSIVGGCVEPLAPEQRLGQPESRGARECDNGPQLAGEIRTGSKFRSGGGNYAEATSMQQKHLYNRGVE